MCVGAGVAPGVQQSRVLAALPTRGIQSDHRELKDAVVARPQPDVSTSTTAPWSAYCDGIASEALFAACASSKVLNQPVATTMSQRSGTVR